MQLAVAVIIFLLFPLVNNSSVFAVFLGDLNNDNVVNQADADIFKPNFGRTGINGFISSDINRDGKVDLLDYNYIVKNFGLTAPTASPTGGAISCNLPPAQESNLSVYAKARNFNVGALIQNICLINNIAICQNTYKNNFDGMRMPFQVSWRGIEPSPGVYDWTGFDRTVTFARNNNFRLHYFHLIWPPDYASNFMPDWIFPGKTDVSCGTRSRDRLYDIIKRRVQSVITHEQNSVVAWNVVNEAFNNARNCFEAISGGNAYIDKAFQYAREVSPNGILVINDAGLPKESLLDYVRSAKSRGIPIDAIGVQNHIQAMTGTSLTEYLQKLEHVLSSARQMRVKVMITEMDVYQGDHSQDVVANVYKKTAALCLKYGNCISLTTWGISDRYTWLQSNQNMINPKPLLFDENFNRKPAYYGVMEALKENATRSCTLP